MKKMLKRDFVGRKARLRRQITNGRGDILDVGEIVKIDGTYRGRFTIHSITKCSHCYRRQKVCVRQVHETDFRLIDEEAQVTNFEKVRIVYITSTDGDWAGIYVDGVLKFQGHSLGVGEVLSAVGFAFEHRELKMDAYEFSSLPEKLEELP